MVGKNLFDAYYTPDDALPDYLDNNDAWQILHITYGAILQDDHLKKALFHALYENEASCIKALPEHIGKHIEKLN